MPWTDAERKTVDFLREKIDQVKDDSAESQSETTAELIRLRGDITALANKHAEESARRDKDIEKLHTLIDKWESRFWGAFLSLAVLVVGAINLAALGLKK